MNNIIIRHSKRIANVDRNKMKFITAQLREYELLQADLPGAFQSEIQDLNNDLQILLDKQLEGVKLRSRAKHVYNLEKPSRYFIKQEKDHHNKKLIKQLNINGNIINDTPGIITHTTEFYKSLLSEEDIDISLIDYFCSSLPKLSDDSSELCNGPITKEEILFSLSKMKSGRCPGSDGLPKEFYDNYIHLFIDQLVEIFNMSYDQNILPSSQRSGIITLLCKDTSKSDFLSQWRPISLLNVDYKLLSKSITNRLSKVLPDIIHLNQTCGVKGRSITDNIHLLSYFDTH